jgi:hypothetical protein
LYPSTQHSLERLQHFKHHLISPRCRLQFKNSLAHGNSNSFRLIGHDYFRVLRRTELICPLEYQNLTQEILKLVTVMRAKLRRVILITIPLVLKVPVNTYSGLFHISTPLVSADMSKHRTKVVPVVECLVYCSSQQRVSSSIPHVYSAPKSNTIMIHRGRLWKYEYTNVRLLDPTVRLVSRSLR